MAGNSIGQFFRVTTFGESHGIALGCIIDGVPPGIPITEADIQLDLDRRPVRGLLVIPLSAVSWIKFAFYPAYLRASLRGPVSG